MEQQIQACRQRLLDNPGNREVFWELEQIFIEKGDWQELVDLHGQHRNLAEWENLLGTLDDLAKQETDDENKSLIILHIGKIAEVELHDVRKAIQSYQLSFKTWKQNFEALEAARTLYRTQNKLEMVLRLYALELKFTPLADEKVLKLCQMAQVAGFQMKNREEGLGYLKNALEIHPEDTEVLKLQDALLSERFTEDVDVPASDPIDGVSVPTTSETTPVEVMEELHASEEANAEELPVETSALEGAVEEEIASESSEPEEEATTESSEPEEEIASESSEPEEEATTESSEPKEEIVSESSEPEEEIVSESSEPEEEIVSESSEPEEEIVSESSEPEEEIVSESSEPEEEEEEEEDHRARWEINADNLLDEAKTAEGESAVKLFVEALNIVLLHEADSERALNIIEAGLESVGEHEEIYHRALNFFEAQEMWDNVAEILEEKIGHSEGDAAMVLRARLALILHDELGDLERAEEIAEELAAENPSHHATLLAAEVLHEDSDDWDALLNEYDTALKARRRKPGESELLAGAAHMLWKRKEDLAAAEKYFKRLKMAGGKEHPLLLEFYCEFYQEKSDWRRYLSSLQAYKNVVDDLSLVLKLAFRMAEIAEEKLKNPAKAISIWKDVLGLDDQNQKARTALCALYERTKKWTNLLEIYREDIAHLPEVATERKINIYNKIVGVYRDKLRNEAQVIHTFKEILELDPNNEQGADALATLYKKSKRWKDLHQILFHKATHCKNVEGAVALHWEIAELLNTRLRNTPKAIESFEKIVELDPTHANALEALRELYKQRKDFPALFQIMGKEAMLVEGEDRVDRLIEQAEMAEEQGAKRRTSRDKDVNWNAMACEAWEGIATASDEPFDALLKLEELYTKHEDHKHLATVYERMREFAEDDAEEAEFIDKLATVHIENLDNKEQAIKLWHEILDLDDDDAIEEALESITTVHLEGENWDALIKLYSERDEHERLFETLDEAAEEIFDEDEQTIVYLKMAKLAAEHLDDDQVIQAYESILEIDETHVETARALLPYYSEHEEHEKEARANQIILAWTENPEETLGLICEIARLFEENLNDYPAAFDWYGRAVQKAPKDSDLREHYEELAKEAETEKLLVQSYIAITNQNKDLDQDTTQALFRTIARVSLEDLADNDQAVTFWEKVLTVIPDDRESINALEDLYATLDRWDSLLNIINLKLELPEVAEDNYQRIELFFNRATTLEDYLERFEEAAQSYQNILNIDEDNLRAVQGLKSLFQRESRWEDLIPILERELDLDADARTEILLELGDTFREKLNNPNTAVDWYERLLNESPNDENAVQNLNILLDVAEQRQRIAVLLENVYDDTEEWADLVRILEIQFEALTDNIDQSDMLWRMFDIRFDELDLAEDAFETAVRVFGVTPQDERAWDELERLAEGLEEEVEGIWKRVANLYNTHKPTSAEDGEDMQFTLLRRLALIHEEHLFDEDSARPCWEMLRSLDAEDLEAINHLETIYRNAPALPELVALLRAKASLDSTGEEQQIDLHFIAAEILEDQLEQPEDAISVYRAIREIEADNTRALENLRRLFASLTRWDDLVALRKEELEYADEDEDRNAILLELGDTFREKLNNPSTAVDWYERLLEESPNHENTVKNLNILLDVAEQRQRIAALLENVYDDTEEWADLVRILEIQFEALTDSAEQSDMLWRMFDIRFDELDLAKGAFETAVRVFGVTPQDERAWDELERLAEGLEEEVEGIWKRVANLYNAHKPASAEDGEDMQFTLLRRLALIHEEHLFDEGNARPCWEMLRGLNAEDLEAIDHLEIIYRNAPALPELVALLRAKASLDSTGEEQQKDLHFDAAEILEDQLEQPEEAILVYRAIREIEEDNTRALENLRRLFASLTRWDDLVTLRKEELEYTNDDDARDAILLELGDIHREKLQDPTTAVNWYENLLNETPNQRAAVQNLNILLEVAEQRQRIATLLENVYDDTQEWSELVRILEIQFEALTDSAEQSDMLWRMFDIRFDELDLAEDAFETAVRVFGVTPQDERTWDELGRLAEGLEEEVEGIWKRVADLYNAHKPTNAEDGEDMQFTLLRRLALIHEEHLFDEGSARPCWEMLRDLDEEDLEAIDHLEVIYRNTSALPELVSLLRAKASLDSSGEEEQKDLHFAAAEILEDQLEQPEEAILVYRAIREIEEDNARALQNLRRLFASLTHWDDLVTLRKEELEYTNDDHARDAILLELGDIHREKLQDPAAAVDWYENLLNETPNQRAAVQNLNILLEVTEQRQRIATLLENVYDDTQEWGELVRILEIRFEALTDSADQSDMLWRMFDIRFDELDLAEDAFETAVRVFGVTPQDERTWDELERLAEGLEEEVEGIWKRVAGLYNAHKPASAENCEDMQLILLRRLALIHEERLSDENSARPCWEMLRGLDEEDLEAIDHLEIIYRNAPALPELVALLRAKASLGSTGEEQQKDLHFAAAEILEDQLEQPEDAILVYRAVREIEEDNARALENLRRLFASLTRWDDLVELRKEELEYTNDDDARDAILLELGDIHREKLQNPAAAIDWYENLLNETPNQSTAVQNLNILLEVAEQRQRIATLLESVYDDTQEWSELVRILEIQFEALTDSADQSDMLWRMFDIRFDELDLAEDAFETAVRVFGVAPQDERTWDELERLAEGLEEEAEGIWKRVADLYNAHKPVSAEDGEDMQFTLLRRLALIHEERLFDEDSARPCWEMLRDLDEEDLEAIDHLEVIYRNTSALPELVSLLRAKASLDSTGEEQQKNLHFDAAEILENQLEQPEKAILSYQAVREIEEDNGRALERLEGLFERLERWDDLVELRKEELNFIFEPEQRHHVFYELGHILEVHKKDPQGAIEAYRSVLEENPTHGKTREKAETLLKRLASEEELEGAAELRQTLTGILEEIFEDEMAHKKLVALLRIRLMDADDTDDIVELNTRIACLLRDELESDEAAFIAFHAAIEHRYEDSDLREEYENLAEVLNAWERVISLYQKGTDTLTGEEDLRILRTRMAQIYQLELGRSEDAISAWQEVLKIESDDRDALDALDDLYFDSSQWNALVKVLRQKLDIVDDQVELLRRIAKIEDESLQDVPSAIQTYNDIFNIVDGDNEALNALERLYQQTENSRELVRVFSEMVRVENEDLDRKRSLFFKMANRYENNLNEPEEAIELYNQVFELDGFEDDEEALNHLDQLFVKQGDHSELDGILRRKLELAFDPKAQTELLYRLGQINQYHLDMKGYSIECYQQIIEQDLHNEESVLALRELLEDEDQRLAASRVLEYVYEQREAWLKLDDILERQLIDTPDDDAQIELLSRIGTQRQTKLEDFDGAFDAWSRALKIDPTQIDFQEQLEDLASITQKFDRLVVVYQEVLENVYDVDRGVELELRVADIYRDELENKADAERFYCLTLERQDNNSQALDSLDNLYVGQKEWDKLLDILEKKLLSESTLNGQISLLFRAAQIHETQRENLTHAIETFRRVIDELEPSNAEALENLERLYRIESVWEDLIELFDHQLGYADGDEECISIKYKLAKVYEEHTEGDDDAVRTFSEILDVNDRHSLTIQALEGLFRKQRETLQVALLLEPIYREVEDQELNLIKVLEARIQHEDDELSAAEFLNEIISIWRDILGDPEAAFEAAGRRFLLTPAELDTRKDLEELAIELKAFERWAALLEKAIEEDDISDPSARLEIMLSLAKLSEELENYSRAEDLYEEVLNEDPQDQVAPRRLEWIHKHNENWDSLIKHYERCVDLTGDNDEQLALLRKIASTHESEREDLTEAIKALKRILELAPELNTIHSEATLRLEKLLRTEIRWEDLAELYREEILLQENEGTPDAVVELKHSLAVLLEEKRGEILEAIDVWREALEIDPKHSAVRSALETLLGALEDAEEDKREAQLPIARLLAEYYDESEDWRALVHAYEIQLQHIEESYDRLELLNKQSILLETYDDTLDLAFGKRASAFLEQSDNRESREELERIAAALAREEDLVAIYRKGLPNCDDPDVRVEILLRTAEIEHFREAFDAAIELYKEALEEAPDNPQPLDALIGLYKQTEKPRELVEALQQKAEGISDPEEQKDLYYEIAKLWETPLGEIEQSIKSFQNVIDIDPDDSTALQELYRLYKQTKAWDALIEVINTILPQLEDEQRTALHFEVAEIFNKYLEDPSMAIESYETILRENPANQNAIDALDVLFRSEDRWSDLGTLLETRFNLAIDASDDATQNLAEFQLACIQEENLDDISNSIGHFKNILDRNPQHPEARSHLENLLNNEDHLEEVIEVLEPLFGDTLEDWSALIHLYELKIATLFDPEDRRQLFLKIALIQEDYLNDEDKVAKAFETFTRAFKEHPSDEDVVLGLHRLTEQLDRWTDLVSIYEEQIKDAESGDQLVDLCLRVAGLQESILDNPTAAIEKYQQVLENDNAHAAALEQLYHLYQKQEAWEPLLETIERLIDVHISDTERVMQLRFQFGELKQHRFEDIEGAIESYREILYEDAQNTNALQALLNLVSNPDYCLEIVEILDPLFQDAEEWETLIGLLERKLDLLEDIAERSEILQRIALIAYEQLGDVQRSFEAYGNALILDPEDTRFIEILEQLTGEYLHNWQQLADVFEASCERLEVEEARNIFDLRVAGIYLEQLEDYAKAEEKYKGVLEREEDNSYALEALEQIYQAQERFTDLLSIYERRANNTFENEDRIRILDNGATLCLHYLPEPDIQRAINFLEQIKEADDTRIETLDQLEGLYEQTENWEALLNILEIKSEQILEEDQVLLLFRKIAIVARDCIGNPDRAIEALRRASDKAPDDLEILQELEALFTSTDQWDEVQSNLTLQIDLIADPKTLISAHLRSTAIAIEKFEDSITAVDHLKMILGIDPSHADALSTLEGIFAAEDDYWELLQVLKQQREVMSAEDRLPIDIKIAHIAHTHLDDSETAKVSLANVLEVQPENVDAISALAEIYDSEGDGGNALELLQQLMVAVQEDPEAVSDVLVKMAFLLQRYEGEESDIEQTLLQAREYNEGNTQALDALILLYEARGDVLSRLGVEEHKAVTIEDPDERVETFLQMTREAASLGEGEMIQRFVEHILNAIFEKPEEDRFAPLMELSEFSTNELESIEYAAYFMQMAYELQPENLDLAEKVLANYIEAEDLEKAMPMLTQIISQLEANKDKKRLPAFYHQRALLALAAGDDEAALASFLAAQKTSATYIPNQIDLGKFYYHREDFKGALKIFQKLLLRKKNITDSSMMLDVYYYLGMVRLHSGDKRRAKEMFKRALEVDPTHAPTLEGVSQL